MKSKKWVKPMLLLVPLFIVLLMSSPLVPVMMFGENVVLTKPMGGMYSIDMKLIDDAVIKEMKKQSDASDPYIGEDIIAYLEIENEKGVTKFGRITMDKGSHHQTYLKVRIPLPYEWSEMYGKQQKRFSIDKVDSNYYSPVNKGEEIQMKVWKGFVYYL